MLEELVVGHGRLGAVLYHVLQEHHAVTAIISVKSKEIIFIEFVSVAGFSA